MGKGNSSSEPQPLASLRLRVAKKTRQLQTQTYALYLAYRDPRTPWFAKAWVALVVAYAISPIDLIPDFIPVLGYLDDLVIVPAGIALAIKLVPSSVMVEAQEKARQSIGLKSRVGWIGAGIVILIWLFVLAGIAWLVSIWMRASQST